MKIHILILTIMISFSLYAQQESIEKILDKDGTIKTDAPGSYDVKGYTMTCDENNKPVFKKDNGINKTTAYTWGSLGTGTNATVYALAVDASGNVYVGGVFTTYGSNVTANHIAKWNSSTGWSALTYNSINGVSNGNVYAIAVSGFDVYVGGDFTTLGNGTAANNIAKWNSSTGWSALTDGTINGVNNAVFALAISGTNVYVGGLFTYLSNNLTVANRIAKWNGTAWSALIDGSSNNGVNNDVNAIAVSGTDIYVGGLFTSAGGVASRIAKWSGTAWSALGQGIDAGTVKAIAVSGSDIYIGGSFTKVNASNINANHIAKWNSSTGWSSLTNGSINGIGGSEVDAIAVSGSDVYVGGNFTTLGDASTANYLAKWSGGAWSSIEGGANALINALIINPLEGKMYMGGNVSLLNGAVNVKYVGTFIDPGNPLPVELTSFTVAASRSSVLLKWETATEVNNYGFEVEHLTEGNWTKIGFVQGAGNSNSPKEYSFRDKSAVNGKHVYRLKQVDTDGKFDYSKTAEADLGLPDKYSLSQNYPNPFNPSTTISFALPEKATVQLSIYNGIGEKVANLINEQMAAGNHQAVWNAGNTCSGVYFYELKTEKFRSAKKLMLMK